MIFRCSFIVTLIYIFCFSAKAQTQYAIKDSKNATLIKSKSLAVVRKEPDAKRIAKLAKKPDKLQQYKKLFEDYNRFLEEAIKREWKFSAVSFISEAEAEKLATEKNDNINLLVTTEMRGHNVSPNRGIDSNATFPDDTAVYELDSDWGVPLLKIASAARPKEFLVVTFIPGIKLGVPVLTYCVQQLINQIEDSEKGLVTSYKDFERSVSLRTPNLKNKTLLFCEEALLDEFKEAIRKGKITKDDYPYPFELVTYDRLAEVIASHDEKYAYVLKVPNLYHDSGRRNHEAYVVDAKDGHIMWFTTRHAFPLFDYENLESLNKDLH